MLNTLKYLAFALILGLTTFGCTNKDDTYWGWALASGGGESSGEDIDDGNGNGDGNGGSDNGDGEDLPPFVLSARGGDGGAGGRLLIDTIEQINILKTGKIDTSLPADQVITPDYGGTPARVAGEVLVRHDPMDASLTLNELFTKGDDRKLYRVTEIINNEGLKLPALTIHSEVISGLEVAEGALMRIEENCKSGVELEFSHDVVIRGTVEATRTMLAMKPAPETPGLKLSTAGHILSADTAEITACGADEVADDPETEPDEFMPAKDGGRIELLAAKNMVLDGKIRANGGNAASGKAGDSGTVMIEAATSHVHNAADIEALGGSGALGGGGALAVKGGDDPATIRIKAAKNVVNSGSLKADGGSATMDGPGGDAGIIELAALIGDIRSSGKLSANGGNASMPSEAPEVCDLNYRGGDGGAIKVKVTHNPLPQLDVYGDVAMTGNISADGGLSGACLGFDKNDGTTEDNYHGRGGTIALGANNDGQYDVALNVNLLAYELVDLAGGDASMAGARNGDGGLAELKSKAESVAIEAIITVAAGLLPEGLLGDIGQILINGSDVTPTDGILIPAI